MSTPEDPRHRGRIVRAEIRCRATPEQVWEAWADPAKISQWFTDDARGEAKTGEVIHWVFKDFGFEFPYEVADAQPGKRLLLTGEIPGRPRFYLEILIEREGGKTLMRLVNSGFLDGAEWDNEYEGIDSGWKMALAALRLYLDEYLGETRRRILVMRPASFELEELLPRHFLDARGLQRWWSRKGSFDGERTAFRMELHDGTPMSGEVLAVTRRELAASWHEERGYVGLKAFQMGPGPRMVGIDFSGWSMTEERCAGIRRLLDASIDRLVASLG